MSKKNIWGISMFKDEADVAFSVCCHLAEEGLTGLIIANNMSTDYTAAELEKVKNCFKDSPCQIVVVEDNEIGYYQSQKMTSLAHKAHDEYWADWIIPFDADELHFAHGGTIANVINDLPENVNVIKADLYNHFPSGVDPAGINPFQTIVYRQKEKGALPKIACKWHRDMVIEQGNHGVQYPFPQVISNCLEIRHFPYRTWEQFKRKALNGAAAYKATNLTNYGQHWLQYAALIEKWGDEVVEWEVFRKYFYFLSPLDNGMIYDPAPFRRWNKC